MIVALNNKCNLTKEEFKEYQKELKTITSKSKLILCASPLNIANFNLSNVSLGSQNVSKDDNGAHTGESSAKQLASYGVTYCIVGHSERRQGQGETNDEVSLKIARLLAENITPILCVGETIGERKAHTYEDLIKEEILSATSSLTPEEKSNLIVAYEPIWSIGTGLIPTNEEITEVFKLIKSLLPTSKVLYGGSANEKNIMDLKACPLIDGYLLGGLSLKPELLEIFLEKLEN